MSNKIKIIQNERNRIQAREMLLSHNVTQTQEKIRKTKYNLHMFHKLFL